MPNLKEYEEKFRRQLIVRTLKECGGSRTLCSRITGYSIRYLRTLITKYEEDGARIAKAKIGRPKKDGRLK